MSIFSDPKNTSKIDQIEDRALSPSVPIVTPGVIAATVGLGAFAMSGSLVIVGCCVAPVVTIAGQRIQRWMKAKRFEREHGCVTHLITSDRDMIAYIKIVGKETVIKQLLLATEDEQPLSRVAKEVLDNLVTPESLPHSKATEYLTAEAATLANSPDANTVDVTAVPVVAETVTVDVVQAFIDDLRCTILCAPPRTGKGIVAARMMQGFKAVYPGGKLFSITIKQFAGEDWYFAPSDAHSNPSNKNSIELGKALYAIYTAWETSESCADAPSLLVIDELRDTLLALKGAKCEDVSPDIQSAIVGFDDWMRGQIVSAATMNQCHKRYLLLISPTSTAQGMTFKDANSLQSYSSFTLVTPTELAFTEGNNGTFGAPTIASDSPLFSGLHGLAWHSKTKRWVGVPALTPEQIKTQESNPVNLKMLEIPQKAAIGVFGTTVKSSTSEAVQNVSRNEVLGESKTVPVIDPEGAVYERLTSKIIDLGGASTTLGKLRTNLSKNQRKFITDTVMDWISNDERFTYEGEEEGMITMSTKIWLKVNSDEV